MLAAGGGHTDILERLTQGDKEISSDQVDRAVRAAAGAGHGQALCLLLHIEPLRQEQLLLAAGVAAARRGHRQVLLVTANISFTSQYPSTDCPNSPGHVS